MKRAILLLAGVITIGCGTTPPTPPVPTESPIEATPTATSTPAFDVQACVAQATADCNKVCAGPQSVTCLTNCNAVRDNTCNKLATP